MDDGSTISGSITFDAALTQVLSYNIVESAGSSFGFNFTAFTYTSANSSVVFNNAFNPFGTGNIAVLEFRTPDYTTNTPGGRTLGLYFQPIPTVIPSTGLALNICGVVPCNDPLFTSIRSGEIVRDPVAGAPFQVQIRNVNGGYFSISDPPLSWNLNFSAEPVLIPGPGGDGTGNPDEDVPEPSTMALLATGLCGAIGRQLKKRRA
jgi:hypothetical protein